MNKTIFESLEFSASFAWFLIAATFIFYTFIELPKGFDNIKGPETVYLQETEIPEVPKWSGSQVRAKLYRISDNEVPIKVNTRTFHTDEDVMKYQSTIRLKDQFSMNVLYDNDGKMSEIVFKKIS